MHTASICAPPRCLQSCRPWSTEALPSCLSRSISFFPAFSSAINLAAHIGHACVCRQICWHDVLWKTRRFLLNRFCRLLLPITIEENAAACEGVHVLFCLKILMCLPSTALKVHHDCRVFKQKIRNVQGVRGKDGRVFLLIHSLPLAGIDFVLFRWKLYLAHLQFLNGRHVSFNGFCGDVKQIPQNDHPFCSRRHAQFLHALPKPTCRGVFVGEALYSRLHAAVSICVRPSPQPH